MSESAALWASLFRASSSVAVSSTPPTVIALMLTSPRWESFSVYVDLAAVAPSLAVRAMVTVVVFDAAGVGSVNVPSALAVTSTALPSSSTAVRATVPFSAATFSVVVAAV